MTAIEVQSLLELMKGFGVTKMTVGGFSAEMPRAAPSSEVPTTTEAVPTAEALVTGMVSDILRRRDPLDVIQEMM